MIQGPLPIICWAGLKRPSASTGWMCSRLASASRSVKAAEGAFRLKTIVLASGNSTLSTTVLNWAAFVFLRSVARPQLNLMSSVVRARPFTGATSWNLMFGRSFIVHLRPSALVSNVSTRSPVGRTSAGLMPGPALYMNRRL